MFYVEQHTIFETVVGSRAYGIHTEESDYDKAGVMIPGKEYFLGLDGINQFQEFESEDKTIYDIRKAINLIADNNPNMMDLLWMPERCIISITPYWQKIVDHRNWFVSKKCRYTYLKYAVSQLRRIKSHRKFLLSPPQKRPERKDFGLLDKTIFPTIQLKAIMSTVFDLVVKEKRVMFVNELDKIYRDYIIPLVASYMQFDMRIVAMEWLQMGIKSQANTFLAVGEKYLKDEYIDMAKREIKFYNAMKEFKQYQEWLKGRNPVRAEMEKRFGFDTKHAAHLVRLCRTGKEIIETGEVHIDRRGIDAEELKLIRYQGLWSYDQLEEYTTKIDEEMTILYENSTLQLSPNIVEIKKLCVEVVDEYLN